jgi:release factor glutamine methyltransferase
MSLRKLVAEAESALRNGPHPERARRDAEMILLHSLQRDRAWLLANWQFEASTEAATAFAAAVARRKQGEPLQYIIGQAEFFGLAFTVAPGVLIPRPETEHLVEEVLQLAANFATPKIADIGTGSGAIAVALAHAMPAASLVATDLSEAALSIASSNARRNQVADSIKFLAGDLLVPIAGRSFDIIASNPPYIPLADRESLSVEVREYEPHNSLFAGDDGLAVYRRLIPQAREFLMPNGWLVLEIGYGQQPAIESLLLASGYTGIRFVQDYQGIPRVAVGRRG